MYKFPNFNKGENNMKVFISWSGDLSKKIAKELSEWLPSIIQSIEVFYSPEDIRKGENWDSRLTTELQNSKYGIVCLTHENVLAPWIHFEAGALSKTLDSRVSALMINIVPSDIEGPLSRFQATKFEKEDFYKLLISINETSETPINENVLQKSFDAIWDKMYQNIKSIITESATEVKKVSQKNKEVNDILQELLQLVRKQDAIISNPEKLLPIDYMAYVNRNVINFDNRPQDVLERVSVEIRRIRDDDESSREIVARCYRVLIDLAEKYGCERGFVHYLQDEYMQSRRIRKRLRINYQENEKPESVEE